MLHVWPMFVRVIHAPNILASLPRPLGGEAGMVIILNSNPRKAIFSSPLERGLGGEAFPYFPIITLAVTLFLSASFATP